MELPCIDATSWPLLQEFFTYDRDVPLEARTVAVSDVDGGTRETIVFRSAQGFLVSGYLQLPETDKASYPCVLLMHGWSGSKDSWYKDFNYISGGNIRKSLLDHGYAVLMLDAQCHGDRNAVNDYAPVNHYVDAQQPVGQRRKGYFTQREIYLQTVIDYRRALDYLESRPEIDASECGLIGYSMGGTQSFMLTATDTRIVAAVACATPAELRPNTVYAPQNFTAAINDRPILVIAGRNDSMCSPAQATALYALLPPATAQLNFYEGTHKLTPDFVPDAVNWIIRHVKR